MTQQESKNKHEEQLKTPIIESFVVNDNGSFRFFTKNDVITEIHYEELISLMEVEQMIKMIKAYAKSLGIKLSGINKKMETFKLSYENYEKTVNWINDIIQTAYEGALNVQERGVHEGWPDDISIKNICCNINMIKRKREDVLSDYYHYIHTYECLKDSYSRLYRYLAESCEVVFEDGTKLQMQFSDQCDTEDCDASIDYTYNDKEGNKIDGGQVDYSTRKNPYHTIQQAVDMVKDFIFDNKKVGEWVNLCGKTVKVPKTLCVIPQMNRNSYIPDLMYV